MASKLPIVPVVVHVRADVPLGVPFKFADRRAVYELVLASDPLTCCSNCALGNRQKRVLCASLSCTPSFRNDKNFCYVRRIK